MPTATLIAPLDKMPQKINHPFGEKRSYEIHPGVDLGTRSGTPVKAPLGGEITNTTMNGPKCGGTIDIDHKNGLWTRFCHMKRIDVKKGDIVSQGQIVGLSGGGSKDVGKGNSKGEHLHWTLKKNYKGGTKGDLVDPMTYLNKSVDVPDDYIASNSSETAASYSEPKNDISSKVDDFFDETDKNYNLLSTLLKPMYTETKNNNKLLDDIKRIKSLIK